MKKDIKLLLIAFVIGSILFFTIVSKILSNDRGIDVVLMIKNDRNFNLQLSYEEESTEDFSFDKWIRKEIVKSDNYQEIMLKLNIRKLNKLKIIFRTIPNNIYIKEIKIIGKNKITIPFDIIENSEHDNMDIFQNQQEVFYIKSLKNNSSIVLDDDIIENRKYTRRNYMNLLALYLSIYFLILGLLSKISDVRIIRKNIT